MSQVLERLLLLGGAARYGIRQVKGRRLILAYHNIVPDGEQPGRDPALHLSRENFARQLDLLQATHDVIPLADLFGNRTNASRPQIAITFDDAYRGALTVGVPELTRRGMPATIFVSPGFAGGGIFWWDAVEITSDTDLEKFRDFALESLRGHTDRVKEWVLAHGHRWIEPPSHATCASEDELRAACRQRGITLASHSWSHPNLTKCTPDELKDELERPLSWLGRKFEPVLPWMAYPYGFTNSAVTEAARQAGYQGTLRVTGGWIPRTIAHTFDLPRWNVSGGIRISGFALRTAGLFCR